MEKKCMVYVAKCMNSVDDYYEFWRKNEFLGENLAEDFSTNPEEELGKVCLFIRNEDGASHILEYGKALYIGIVDKSADHNDTVEVLRRMLWAKNLSVKEIECAIEEYKNMIRREEQRKEQEKKHVFIIGGPCFGR